MRLLVSLRLVLAGCSFAISCIAAPVHAAGPPNISSPLAPSQMPSSVSPQPVATSAAAVTPYANSRPFIPTRVAPLTPADAHVTQPRYAPGYFGGAASRASLSQLPRRRAIQPAPPQPMRAPTKPFETMYPEPPISPYLNLEREENDAH